MNDWKQKRLPDEVPTPLAVAVSDFCRRAKAPSSPQEVREALACLSGEDDFRVRPITDAEPEASPLGPFALVDLVLGAPAELAARRQACGYYELVRSIAAKAPSPAAAQAPAPPPARPAPARSPASKAKEQAQTLAQKVAPKKRPAQEQEDGPAESPPEAVPDESSHKRSLPSPRGRFTRLAAAKAPATDLKEPAAKPHLANLLAQHGHRAALLSALSEQYVGRGGAPLTWPDIQEALEQHELSADLASRERDLVLAGYREHRGASGRVAWALGMSPGELDRLINTAGLTKEVEELRERFKREALSPDLRYRLDLLGRTKYLADLGIKRRFMEQLTADVQRLLEGCLEGASDLPSLIQAAARRHGLAPELLSRAADKLGLNEQLLRKLSPRTVNSVP